MAVGLAAGFFLFDNKQTSQITVHSVLLIQFRIFSPGAVDCDSSIRLERLILDFLPAPAAAGWLHCISSHTKNHHGAHPETANTEELTWMGSSSLWD